MEYFAKDANKLFFHSQDGICHIACSLLKAEFVAFVKTTGTLDMYAQTAVLLFITDQLIATSVERFFAVECAQKIITQLVNSQELELSFKLEKESNHVSPTVSFVVNALFSKWEMIFGVTAAETFDVKVRKLMI